MTTGNIVEIFQPFQVTIPENVRYWEDEDTGVIIKRGQIVTISQRSARSNNLRFALLRNRVLMKDGQYVFAFREEVVKVTPGDKKNLVTPIRGPNVKKEEHVSKVEDENKKATEEKVDILQQEYEEDTLE